MLRITFLGTAGTVPTPERSPSAILVNRKGELMLFDCGEGTQQQMMRAKTGMGNLSAIYLTHFHADHVLGVPGLLQTMALNERAEPITIYGPPQVIDFMDAISDLGCTDLGYEVTPCVLRPGESVRKDGYSVLAVRTEHTIPSFGFALIEDARPGRFNREKAVGLGIPVGPLFSKLQRGEPVTTGGRTVMPGEVLGPARPGRKLVYSGDTRPCSQIAIASRDADVLIHDGTLTSDMQGWAVETRHSTAREAALLARDASVRQLILTHISSRYSESTAPLLEEAHTVFGNVTVAREFMEIEVPLRD
ncbi:MAG TPA: ribonuclease Z [Candidatus Methanoperedenaceae archaeon]|nr:ribonuclease Z [Candidatus Methanoperedenaceae archaeon]